MLKVVVFAFTILAITCGQCQQQVTSAVTKSSVCLCVDAPDRMELGDYMDLIGALRDAAKEKLTGRPEVGINSVPVRGGAVSGCDYVLRPSAPEYSEGKRYAGSSVELWLLRTGKEKAIMHSYAYDTWVAPPHTNKLMPTVAKQVLTAIDKDQRQSSKSTSALTCGECQQRVNTAPKSSARLCLYVPRSMEFRDYNNLIDSLREAATPEHTAPAVDVNPVFVVVEAPAGCDYVLLLIMAHESGSTTTQLEFQLFPAGSEKAIMHYSAARVGGVFWKSSESKQLMATVAQETVKAVENDPRQSSKRGP